MLKSVCVLVDESECAHGLSYTIDPPLILDFSFLNKLFDKQIQNRHYAALGPLTPQIKGIIEIHYFTAPRQ